MKINNNDLKKYYRSYIRRKIPFLRKSCPSWEKIIDFFSRSSSESEKNKIIDHVSNCCFCAEIFEYLLQTLRGEQKFNQKKNYLLLSEKEINEIKRKVYASNFLLGNKQGFPFFRLSWKYISLLLTIVLVVIFLIFVKKPILQVKKTEQRGGEIYYIKLIDPVGIKYSINSLTFRWSKLEDSDYYIMELFDETLNVIWRSEEIYNNYCILSDEIFKNLKKNRIYFWMVTAYLSTEEKIESDLQKFILSDYEMANKVDQNN